MRGKHVFAVLVVFAAVTMLPADASAMYHPTIGRFMSRDPGPGGPAAPRIGQYRDGMNLYQYVRSGPVSLVDPYGLWYTDIHETATTQWSGEARGYDEKRKCKTMFSPDVAAAIGAADEAIDALGPTHPVVDPSWHFRIRGSQAKEDQAMRAALEDVTRAMIAPPEERNASCASAITHLGNSLHPLQDAYSHTETHGAATPEDHAKTSARSKLPNWSPGWCPDPDSAAAWPEDVAAAGEATKARLKEFLSLPCNPCVQCEGTK